VRVLFAGFNLGLSTVRAATRLGCALAVTVTFVPVAWGGCVLNGTQLTCSGADIAVDLPAGGSNTIKTIIIDNVTERINATAGCTVDIYGTGPLAIDVDTATFGLVSGGYGLTATVTTGPGGISIRNAGEVVSGSTHAAIYGETRGGGLVSITNVGDLSGGLRGIWTRTSHGGGAIVDHTGDITVSGEAILADAQTVVVTHRGGRISALQGIVATGVSSAAVEVLGGDIDAADIAVSVNNGSVTVAHGATVVGANYGVAFAAGTNVLHNYGTIRSSNVAVAGGMDADTVDNYGVIAGSVDLDAGANAFNNMSGGRLDAGNILLHGGVITNAGILSPGGDGTVRTTNVQGSLVQTASGTYVVDVTKAGMAPAAADLLLITNGTATLSGKVAVRRSGDLGVSGSIVIVETDNPSDLTNNLDDVKWSGGYEYTLSDDTRFLTLSWLFAPSIAKHIAEDDIVLAPNQQETAEHLDRAHDSGNGSPAFEDLFDAINNMTSAGAQKAVERLDPEHFGVQVNETSQASQAFMSSVMSCPTHGQGPGFIQEGECFWAKVGARQFDWNKTAHNVGGEEEAWSTSGGVQVALRDAWRLGFAGYYEHANAVTLNAASTDTDRAQGAVLIKNRWDTISLAASAFAGYGWSDSRRVIGFGGLGAAESSHDMWFSGTQLRLSQLFERQGGTYVKPMIDLNATRLETEAFTETGAGAANLSVAARTHAIYFASPALEIGMQFRSGAVTLRPYARFGATFFAGATYETTASFVSAPGLGFTVQSAFDTSYVDVAAGVDMLTAAGIDVKLSYDGRFSENSEMHSGGLKASVPF